MSQSKASRMEAACSLLAESERRFLLYQLAEAGSATLDDLMHQILVWEQDGSSAAVDSERKQRCYIAMVHNHLPRLADHDIVEYDLRSGDVVLSSGFEDIRPLLDQFRQTEEEHEIRQLPPL